MTIKDLEDKGLIHDGKLTAKARLLMPAWMHNSHPRPLERHTAFRTPLLCAHTHTRWTGSKWECVDCGVYV